MVEPDRRPSAQEIDELTDLVRRDPSSPAFIDLGEAYLALGRPREAIDVGTAGLVATPDNMEGRVMVARAHIALHQWKEGQAELLKVVKVDRTNKAGFALLGEVLLRRSDYERAVPVLQHAQNLDPTSPQVLTLLRRARAGQALDPPPPVPTPMQPRGAARRPAAPPSAPPRREPPPPQPLVPNFDDTGEVAVPPPRLLDQPPRRAPEPAPAPPPRRAAPPPAPEPDPEPPRRQARASVAPPVGPTSAAGEPIRPRVVQTTKPQNAAQASLRQSAAVGENYLNDLLTGGLLEVAGVRVPEIEYDLRPDRRWGRSTTRMFIVLFVLMFLGLGAGGYYWWYTEKEKAAAVAKAQKDAQEKIVHGDFAGLEAALGALKIGLESDPESTLTMAYVAEVAGLEALLYGTDTDRVDMAIKQAQRDITKPTQKGYRELVIGRAAVDLSRLARLEPAGAITALQKINTDLDAWLADHADDQWARWLKGRAQLAAGQRKAAITSISHAASGGGDGAKGLVVAMIDEADLLVDEGKLADATKLYEKALAASPAHPLALLGRALGRAEAGVEARAAIDDLSVELDKPLGPRVAAFRQLAIALADYATEDYLGFKEALASSQSGQTVPSEPRFLARIAMANLNAGDLEGAARARGAVHWFGKETAETDPLAQLVDTGLLVASGLPQRAYEEAAKQEGVRARIYRVQSLLDLQKYKDALTEADELLGLAPDNREAQVLREWARIAANSGSERDDAIKALDKVALNTKSKIGRHAQGMAAMAINSPDARTRLEQALKDITDEAPHPVVYRTHTALAQLLLSLGDAPGAAAHINDARTANQGYQPANVIAARLMLANGQPEDATAALQLVYKDEKNGAVTPEVELLACEAQVRTKGVTQQIKDQVVKKLEELKGKGVNPAEIGRVAAMIDEDLPEKLGVPTPEGGGSGGSSPAPAPKRKRNR
jgi:tetratricopeptide (TPR) repeat protein